MSSGAETEYGRGAAGLPQQLDQALRALQASRERELLLRNELAHRVRNIFAINRSIFSRTVETSDTLEHAANHFLGRLDALARYHGRSASSPMLGFDLEDMIHAELLVYAVIDDARVHVDGPAVRLDDRSSEVMGIVLHELTTNAIKFGALADDGGHGSLRIGWSVEDGAIDFQWTEKGVAIVTPAPMPEGFGRELIERVLPYQLGAETSFAIMPGGLSCRIRFALQENARFADPYD